MKAGDDRKVLEFHFKQTILGRPFAASPNVPKDRLAALRSAFLATMKDPEFLADAKKFNLDIDIATADDVSRLLAEFARLSEVGDRQGEGGHRPLTADAQRRYNSGRIARWRSPIPKNRPDKASCSGIRAA